jgi:endonuclease III
MIDPKNIIKFDRTEKELQELILFLISVAGKNAARTAKLLDKFLKTEQRMWNAPLTPFELIQGAKGWDRLNSGIKEAGFGCHTRLTRAFDEIAHSKINLRNCTISELMSIHGIGRKSASCFMCWTRPKMKLAMLDTHILKFIRHELGYVDAPKSTPSSDFQYSKWEKVYLDYCEKMEKDPTKYDLQIWKKYAYNE